MLSGAVSFEMSCFQALKHHVAWCSIHRMCLILRLPVDNCHATPGILSIKFTLHIVRWKGLTIHPAPILKHLPFHHQSHMAKLRLPNLLSSERFLPPLPLQEEGPASWGVVVGACSVSDGAEAHGAIRRLDNSGALFLIRWFVISVGLAHQLKRQV
jgi:hypothetical protein